MSAQTVVRNQSVMYNLRGAESLTARSKGRTLIYLCT